jgi:hypothetical protein
MTAGPIRRSASRVLATLVTLLFLFASLPEPPLGWFSRLLLFLVPVLLMPVLLKWGPSLPSIGYLRVAILISAALFAASLLSRAAERGDLGEVGFTVTVLIALVIICGRQTPKARKSSLLRVGVFSAIALFGLCLRIALYSSFANMKRGDFWVAWLPFQQSLILPPPYDFYIVARLIPALLWMSLLAALIFSGLYFWQRNSEAKICSK